MVGLRRAEKVGGARAREEVVGELQESISLPGLLRFGKRVRHETSWRRESASRSVDWSELDALIAEGNRKSSVTLSLEIRNDIGSISGLRCRVSRRKQVRRELPTRSSG